MISILQNEKDVNKYNNNPCRKRLKLKDSCPICNRKMHSHGGYFRYVWAGKGPYFKIIIYRHYCPECGLTISHLPAFLLPYHVIAVPVINEIVRQYKSNGISIRSIAKLFDIARSTVQHCVRKHMDSTVDGLQCST